MSSDVREAAERLRRARKDSDEFDGGYPDTVSGRSQSILDHAMLAAAYLYEHPADDDEPVSEEWLLSVGFSEDDTTMFRYGPITLHRCGGREWRVEFDMWEFFPEQSQGAVRRLLSVFGHTLELKEPTNDQ